MGLDDWHLEQVRKRGEQGRMFIPTALNTEDAIDEFTAHQAGASGVPSLRMPRAERETTNDGPLSKVVGFLIMVVLLGGFFGFLAIKPRIDNYFNQRTEPLAANTFAKDALNHQSYSDGEYWYQISANKGDAEGEFGLGMLLNEKGIDAPTEANGLALIKKAGASGYAPAKQWLSASQGDLEAEFRLGMILNKWGSDAFSEATGQTWMKKAAASGFAPAAQWLSANRGDVAAEFRLGVFLNDNPSDALSPVNGRAWISSAAASGYAPAKQWLLKNAK